MFKNPAGNTSPTGLYISAITQRVHSTPTCSMTQRNHAYNLATDATATELAAKAYAGCKRCDGHALLTAAAATVQAPQMTPTKPGQMVRHIEGDLGITTSAPTAKGRIGVMLVAGRYPINVQAAELTVVEN